MTSQRVPPSILPLSTLDYALISYFLDHANAQALIALQGISTIGPGQQRDTCAVTIVCNRWRNF